MADVKRVFYVKYLAHTIYIDILKTRSDIRLDKLENDSPDDVATPVLAGAHAFQIERRFTAGGVTPLSGSPTGAPARNTSPTSSAEAGRSFASRLRQRMMIAAIGSGRDTKVRRSGAGSTRRAIAVSTGESPLKGSLPLSSS